MTGIDVSRPLPELMAALTAVAAAVEAESAPLRARENVQESDEIARLLRVERAATEARVAATRLQCLALRRLAQLGAASSLTPAKRQAATAFASLAAEEWADFLDSITQITSPVTAYQTLRSERVRQEVERRTGIRFHYLMNDFWQPDFPDPPVDEGEHAEVESILDAVAVLLTEPPFDEEAYRVSDLADRLADRLRDHGFQMDPIEELRPLLDEAARRGIALGGVDGTGVPRTLTVYTQEDGYVRIASTSARLAHLRAHALLRREQANQLERKAVELERIVARYTGALGEGEDDRTEIAVLAARLREGR